MASDEHVLVIGATSMIAHESLKPYAVAGRTTLWARSVAKLERVQGDLQARGAFEWLRCGRCFGLSWDAIENR